MDSFDFGSSICVQSYFFNVQLCCESGRIFADCCERCIALALVESSQSLVGDKDNVGIELL